MTRHFAGIEGFIIESLVSLDLYSKQSPSYPSSGCCLFAVIMEVLFQHQRTARESTNWAVDLRQMLHKVSIGAHSVFLFIINLVMRRAGNPRICCTSHFNGLTFSPDLWRAATHHQLIYSRDNSAFRGPM